MNEVVEALNWCSGSSSGGDSLVTSDHEDVLQHIHSCVKAIGPDVEELSTQEAASALLKGRLDYSSEKSGTTSLASYRRGELSLPTDISGSPMVSDVCDDSARVFLEDECQRMLRSDSSLF